MARAAGPEPKKRLGNVSLPALRVFVAVIEAGSFSKAAETLGTSQPNVSLQIASLERTCGVRLLQRRQPISLTDGGRDLFVRARLILSRVDEFESSVRDLRDLQRGRLTIGFSSPAVALGLIARFLRQHPAIELVTGLGNSQSLLADIGNCDIDIGIMTLTQPASGLTSTLIGKQQLVACFPRRHPLAKARSVSIQQLAAQPLVIREPGSVTQLVLEQALAARGMTPRVALRVRSREALKEAVAAGIGVGTLFDDEAGQERRLRILPITGAPTTAGVYAVCLEESTDLPAVSAFIALAGS